jgi:hypothetical protein
MQLGRCLGVPRPLRSRLRARLCAPWPAQQPVCRLHAPCAAPPAPQRRGSRSGPGAAAAAARAHAASAGGGSGSSGSSGGAPLPAPAPRPAPPQLTLDEVLSRCRAAVGEGLAAIKGGEVRGGGRAGGWGGGARGAGAGTVWRRRRGAAAAAAPAPLAASLSHTTSPPPPAPQVIVHGTGHHLGSQVAWSLRFRRDGAFYEEIRSKYLTFKWGYDGSPDSTCWEVDPAGVAKHLEYDDHEVEGGAGGGGGSVRVSPRVLELGVGLELRHTGIWMQTRWPTAVGCVGSCRCAA